MSAAVPLPVKGARRRGAQSVLRATGPAGMASAAVIAVATFGAISG